MTNITSTIWPIEPHTKAKHVILENHLKAWFPILSSKFGRVVYLDGFAGPGIYSKGEKGSPVIALKTATDHIFNKNFGKITFAFIEKEHDRAEKLREVLKSEFPTISEKWNYQVHEGGFAETIEETLNSLEKDNLKLAPTFAFIDPFGYTHFPMTTIAHLMSHERCEVLITFMIDYINRFGEIQKEALDELFGDDGWQKAEIPNEPKTRREFFLNHYTNQLKKIAKVKFTRTFEMVRSDGHTEYFLVFGTNHPKGMEVMKNAMYKADSRGTYRFSDREDPNQTFLTDVTEDIEISNAADAVFEKFRGQKVYVPTIKNFVWAETRFRFKSAILERLENNDKPKIKVNGRKVRGFNYPDRCLIEFSDN